ncbi:hypothetical protein E3V33_04810 [Candidatus Marinimicrobia bacterium MT.SAG.4]|nr:hypothetical protein E3V33_04810 [Candidatus Marinimicrobia bacterium MT.SAG.4]
MLDKDLLLYWYYIIQEKFPDLKKGNKLYGELSFLRDVINNHFGNVNDKPDLEWLIVLKLTIPKIHYEIDYREIIKENKISKYRRLYEPNKKLYLDYETKAIVYSELLSNKNSDWREAISYDDKNLVETYLIPDEKPFAQHYVSYKQYLKQGHMDVQKDLDIFDNILTLVIPKPLKKHISKFVENIEREMEDKLDDLSYKFQKLGDTYHLKFGRSQKFTLHQSKGLDYLTILIRNEGKIISSLNLAGSDIKISNETISDKFAFADGLSELSVSTLLNEGILNKKQIDEFKNLRTEYDNLSDFGKEAEAEEVRDKMLQMLQQKSKETIHYRQNARLSVRKAIAAAINKIRENDEKFADHLTQNVKKGYDCIYNPLEKGEWLT